jgi:lycopene beta-cyclase
MTVAEPLVTQASHVIVGGGLAGGLAALALALAGRGARVVLVEGGAAIGGNHTWSCHDSDLDGRVRGLVLPLVSRRWPRHVVRFPGRERALESGYLTITSERFGRLVHEHLARARTEVAFGESAVELGERGVRLASGRIIEADVVIDARGPQLEPGAAWRGYQKFVGLELALDEDGPWEEPVIMDASVDQEGGFRFVYVLPFSRRHVLVEDTIYADDGAIDVPAFESRVRAYAEAHGARGARVLRREMGVLPLPIARSAERDFARGPIAIGYRGGFFHGVTGYSLPEAARVALAIADAETREDTGAALAELRRAVAGQRGFERLLGRLLFGAMSAETRWTALDRFYRLPDATIARFYAARTTAFDRARVLLGRPPAGLSWRRLIAGAREAS